MVVYRTTSSVRAPLFSITVAAGPPVSGCKAHGSPASTRKLLVFFVLSHVGLVLPSSTEAGAKARRAMPASCSGQSILRLAVPTATLVLSREDNGVIFLTLRFFSLANTVLITAIRIFEMQLFCGDGANV